ncbi:MAG: fatty acyl-AMP ligase [Nakamurella multipartita]|jgi:fatty-acyl-CoA synthase
MSAFSDALCTAAQGPTGMTTGEPHEPVRTSWADVHAKACAGARVLAAHGIGPGDAVAVLAAKPFEVAPIAQAAWLAGASVTMLHQPTARTNLMTYAQDTAAVLSLVGAKAAVLGDPFTEFAELLDGSGVLALTVDDLLAEPGGPAPDVEIGEDLPALLQLTSGSTSTPKAVRITHRNLWANIEAMCQAAQIRPGEVMVSWLPLFHDMGMVGFLTLPMCRGIELVTVTPTDFLASPLIWPTLISKYRGTITAAPNFAFALTARVLARPTTRELGLDLSCMRFALNGAEPIDVAAVRAFLAAGAPFGLPETAVVCAYGMAEASLAVSFHPWGTPLKVDTVDAQALEIARRAVPAESGRSFPVLGPPLDGIEVAVRGRDGAVLGDREVGVLHLRGECITEQYLTVDGPVATQDADKWLDTGDLGYLVDGEVVVCGRVKDVIIMGGRNIYPTDIERVAQSIDGVRAGNAVAVRWTTPSGRESFAVAVESREAGDQDAAERIRQAVRSAVTAEIGARPATVSVLPVGSLPKTPSGKLQRSAAARLITPPPAEALPVQPPAPEGLPLPG